MSPACFGFIIGATTPIAGALLPGANLNGTYRYTSELPERSLSAGCAYPQ
ncbi:hypothetical protein [Cupriavidus lacunae]|nr:hypothetical protein [Cupriavidus lacunae]